MAKLTGGWNYEEMVCHRSLLQIRQQAFLTDQRGLEPRYSAGLPKHRGQEDPGQGQWEQRHCE